MDNLKKCTFRVPQHLADYLRVESKVQKKKMYVLIKDACSRMASDSKKDINKQSEYYRDALRVVYSDDGKSQKLVKLGTKLTEQTLIDLRTAATSHRSNGLRRTLDKAFYVAIQMHYSLCKYNFGQRGRGRYVWGNDSLSVSKEDQEKVTDLTIHPQFWIEDGIKEVDAISSTSRIMVDAKVLICGIYKNHPNHSLFIHFFNQQYPRIVTTSREFEELMQFLWNSKIKIPFKPDENLHGAIERIFYAGLDVCEITQGDFLKANNFIKENKPTNPDVRQVVFLMAAHRILGENGNVIVTDYQWAKLAYRAHLTPYVAYSDKKYILGHERLVEKARAEERQMDEYARKFNSGVDSHEKQIE